MSRINAVLAIVSAAGMTSASTLTLEDGNSTAVFNVAGGIQQVDWIVDGFDHLANQQFAVQFNGVPSIVLLGDAAAPLTGASVVNTNRDPAEDVLAAEFVFAVEELEIMTRYFLNGGQVGSGSSDIQEVVNITNTGSDTIVFSFFQFIDFDLAGTAFDTSVALSNDQTATQVDVSNGVVEAEMVVSGQPEDALLDFIGQVGLASDVLAALNNGALNDVSIFSGQGDLAFAFEWQIELEAGESFLISGDRLIDVIEPIPTPSAVLALVGGGIVAARRRR